MAPLSSPSDSNAAPSSNQAASGMQTSPAMLIFTAIAVATILFFSIPQLIQYGRYPIPEDVGALIGRPGLNIEQLAKITEALQLYYAVPTKSFFPICAAIIAGLFAVAEGLCWKRGSTILLALIAGPLIGLGIGYAVSEISMMFFFNSGKSMNPAITDGLSMQAISLGLMGSGAGLAIGVTARSLLVAITGAVAGILSGIIASAIFVIGTTVLFPMQDVFYPIPGTKLESLGDYGAIGVWSLALPICLGIALSAARKKPADESTKTSDSPRNPDSPMPPPANPEQKEN